MGDIRDKAKEILAPIPEPPAIITSNGKTHDLFTRLTDVSQETMKANWDKGGIMTACNGFVGWYARALGSKTYLGGFDLEGLVKKAGKGFSYVKSTPDNRPKYGDICRHTAFHVGVSLDFDGDKWRHVDAGQGGPKMGCDVLKRTYSTDDYDYKNLHGWIDIELYFGGTPAIGPVPDWLLGWWKVMWRGQAFYYYFDAGRQVKWTRTEPDDTSSPLVMGNDTAACVIFLDNTITIRWNNSGSVEKFTKSSDDSPMRGTWNDSEPLTAEKL